MLSRTFLLAAASAAIAIATPEASPDPRAIQPANTTEPIPQKFDCGTDTSKAKADFLNSVKALAADQSSGSPAAIAARSAFEKRQTSQISINVYFHIITTEAKASQISDKMIEDQWQALNAAYNPQGITFANAGVDKIVDDIWAVGAGSADYEMKKALRKGTYADLNIYFQTDLADNILGKCTLPASIGGGVVPPSVYVTDGCNVHAGSMPNGNVYGYNQGKTAVHEVGHWMGLLHTFEGYSCSGNGDYIKDTPQQMTSTNGCPVKPVKDSCKKVAGIDPIHNYMDYSTDACYTGFTKGQQQRMQTMWTMYRAGR